MRRSASILAAATVACGTGVEPERMVRDAGPPPVARLEVRIGETPLAPGTQLELADIRRYAPSSTIAVTLASVGELPADVVVEVDGGFVASETQLVIDPGDTADVVLRLATTSTAGTISGALEITGGSDEPRTFGVTAVVEPYILDVAQPWPAVTAIAETRFTEQALVGLGIGIARGQDLIYLEGFGAQDLAQGIPVDPRRTMFRWASLGKGVTGVAAAMASLDGSLDLDAQVSTIVDEYQVPTDYLPAGCAAIDCAVPIPERRRVVTTRMLLHHVAGVMHYSNGIRSPVPPSSQTADPQINTGMAWAVAIWKDWPLVAIPGDRYSYSTFGYNLAGVSIERAVGRSYWSYVAERITDPLEMYTFQPDYEWAQIPDRAVGYRNEGAVPADVGSTDVSWKLAAGGSVSTVEDLTKWCAAFLGDEIVTDDVRALVFTPSRPAPGYGLGFNIGALGGRRTWSHSGGQEKTRTYLRIYPDDDVCFVAMSNSAEASLAPILEEIADVYWASR